MNCVTAPISGIVFLYFPEPFKMVHFFVEHLLIQRGCSHADFVQQLQPLSALAGDAVTLKNSVQQPDYMP